MRKTIRMGGLLALVLFLFGLPAKTAALPAWARKYNMNCNGCHAPAVPRLNAFGFKFKWAGYRLPEEIGEKQEVQNVSDYIAARMAVQYAYNKTEGSPPTTSQFELDNATIFAGGAIGKHFGAFLEFAHSENGTELVNHVSGVWGQAENYGGFRVGRMHWLLEAAVAGFDRPTGLAMPTPLGNQLTSALPFVFDGPQLGLEAFWVKGRNRLSAEVLNGFTASGTVAPGDTKKDVALIDQFIFDKQGSGVTAVAYFGHIVGADPIAPTLTSTFTRLAITANKIFGPAELMAGYAYGEDTDLPIATGSAFTTASVKGNGFWLYGGYTLPKSKMTLFSRYEVVNPNSGVADQGNTRFVLGSVLPVEMPEYLRFALEYTLDQPKGPGSLKQHGLVGQVMIAF